MACYSVCDLAEIQRAIDIKDKERTILREWLMAGNFEAKIITECLDRFEEGYTIDKEVKMSEHGFNSIELRIYKHYNFLK